MSAGGTQEPDSGSSNASAKRERSLFSVTDINSIREEARKLAVDDAALLDFARDETMEALVILSRLKYKVKGRQAAAQTVAAIKEMKQMLGVILKHADKLRPPQEELDGGDTGREAAARS